MYKSFKRVYEKGSLAKIFFFPEEFQAEIQCSKVLINGWVEAVLQLNPPSINTRDFGVKEVIA